MLATAVNTLLVLLGNGFYIIVYAQASQKFFITFLFI
jgi:hypothetical protein